MASTQFNPVVHSIFDPGAAYQDLSGTNIVFGKSVAIWYLTGDPAPAFDAPAGVTPTDLFMHTESEHIRCHETAYRFLRRDNDREILVYVDGSCLDQNNSQDTSTRRAGCAWVYKPASCSQSIQLESWGPSGFPYHPTSNRAELRAALGALQFRKWYGEMWQRIVIATDSEYVVFGITQRIENWATRNWRTSAGTMVKNDDLWKAFLGRINELAEHGTEVAFWKIPREQNTMADQAAKDAALHKTAVRDFAVTRGVAV